MQMWDCLHLCNIKKNKFTYSHYLFVTEAPWYYACRREVSILGRGPFPCYPGQKTLPYIELSNGGVDPNVWQGGTRHKSGASDIELLFCLEFRMPKGPKFGRSWEMRPASLGL